MVGKEKSGKENKERRILLFIYLKTIFLRAKVEMILPKVI